MSVAVNGDTVPEPDETFLVSFRNPTNATLGGFFGLGYGVILDDEPGTKVVPGIGTVDEGPQRPTTLEVPVTLSSEATDTVTVDWTLRAGTAVTPADFTGPPTGTFTFAPGETAADGDRDGER